MPLFSVLVSSEDDSHPNAIIFFFHFPLIINIERAFLHVFPFAIFNDSSAFFSVSISNIKADIKIVSGEWLWRCGMREGFQ